MKTLLGLLLLTGLAGAQPVFFKAAADRQLGNVLLVADDGAKEAEALARAGYNCRLSRAADLEQLKGDEFWLRKKAGWEANRDLPITVIGLDAKAALVWKLGGGVICIDAHPQAYQKPGGFKEPKAMPTLVELLDYRGEEAIRYERDLKAYKPLVLVPPGTNDELCQQLGPNCHKAAGSLSEMDSPLQKEVRRWLAIQQPHPRLGLTGTQWVPSPNWGQRDLGDRIDTVVLHSTGINTLEGTEHAFCDDKDSRISAHYVVDRDGTTVQMVDERCSAWHAGASELEGRRGVNDFSIGIELVSLNDGQEPYPEAQYEAVVRIIKDLRKRWAVPPNHIVSEAAIARPPGRKTDPVGFDFDKLKAMLEK